MKVYLATSGEYSDYRVCHVFARREDAEAYEGSDHVEEYEVRDGPVEMRTWYRFIWLAGSPDRERDGLQPANPHWYTEQRDFDGDPRHVRHHWHGPPERTGRVLEIEGWDLSRIKKVYSEQRAQYLAKQQGVS
jgi:hypothetical protein